MNANINTTTYKDSALIESSNTLSRKVIVNVDDLGLSEPVNDAVINLAQKRLITASSYMVGGHIDNTSIKALYTSNIDVGLHLDFTGVFKTTLPKSLPKLLKASYLQGIKANDVANEIKQQLDIFEDTFNHAPRFIDGHQHVHQFPIIRQCLMNELLSRYGKSLSHTMAARVTTPINYDLKAWVIYSLGGQQWKALCEQTGVITNSHFGGVYDFEAHSDKLTKLWDRWLGQCPIGIGGFDEKNSHYPISVIMCHPATPYDNWNDGIKEAREREYQWMKSGALKTLYDKHSIELTHWRDMYTKKKPPR